MKFKNGIRPNRTPKLARRQAEWDGMRTEGSDRGGRAKWVKTEGGKNQLFHRPGSNK